MGKAFVVDVRLRRRGGGEEGRRGGGKASRGREGGLRRGMDDYMKKKKGSKRASGREWRRAALHQRITACCKTQWSEKDWRQWGVRVDYLGCSSVHICVCVWVCVCVRIRV